MDVADHQGLGRGESRKVWCVASHGGRDAVWQLSCVRSCDGLGGAHLRVSPLSLQIVFNILFFLSFLETLDVLMLIFIL